MKVANRNGSKRGLKILFAKCLAVLSAVPIILYAFATGPDAHHTGVPAPANEPTCAMSGCHTGTPVNGGGGNVTVTFPSGATYTPGVKQTLTIRITDSQALRYGFQMTARPMTNLSGGQAGTFSPDPAKQFVLCASSSSGDLGIPRTGATCPSSRPIEFVEHSSPYTPNTFTVDWTPPSSDVGPIGIYIAANASRNPPGPQGCGSGPTSTCHIYIANYPLTASGGPAPTISDGGVVGAGLSNPLVKTISPNGIISIFGQNFAAAGTVKLAGGGDLVGGKLPANFAGLCAQVGSDRARFFHVFPNQLNVQAPTLTDRGPVQVKVIQNCDQPNAMESNVQMVTMVDRAPEFFFFKQNTGGVNPVAAINALTGAFIGAPGLLPGATFTPAKPGDILSLFSTGFGATNPPFQAGDLPDKIAPTTAKATVSVNGVTLADSDMLYAGVAPNLAGLYQINIRVPANAPDGDLPVVATVGSVSTPAGAFITVKK